MQYKVMWGTPERYREMVVSDYNRANDFYKRMDKFATNHGLQWTIALWGIGTGGNWLFKSKRFY